MAEGYIYILFNPAYRANQYKIGMTTKTPEARAAEISAATGVPQPFEVLYERKVVDCTQAERLLHQRLSQFRSTSGREFFEIALKTAITTLNEVASEVGITESDAESFRADNDERIAKTIDTLSAEIDLVSKSPSRHRDTEPSVNNHASEI